MDMQAIMNNVSSGVSHAASFVGSAASTGAQWCGHMVTVISSTLAGTAQAVANFAGPYLAALKDFAVANQGYILVAAVAATAGFLAHALFASSATAQAPAVAG